MELPFGMGGAVLLENWDGFVREEYGKEIEVDGLGLAEEFEEDFDPFFCGGEFLNGASHALERTVGDFNFIADGEVWGDCDEFGFAMGLLRNLMDERGDERYGDVWNFRTEADETANALAECDGAFHFGKIEFGK